MSDVVPLCVAAAALAISCLNLGWVLGRKSGRRERDDETALRQTNR